MRFVIEKAIGISGLSIGSCVTAEDGNTALNLLRKQQVDLILTDLNMPGMSGEDLMREVRNDAALRRIPFIIISADASSTRIQNVLDLGASGYIVKPFGAEVLKLQMARVLEQVHERN
jgi:two-component system chemotaxis response regulator CheY